MTTLHKKWNLAEWHPVAALAVLYWWLAALTDTGLKPGENERDGLRQSRVRLTRQSRKQ